MPWNALDVDGNLYMPPDGTSIYALEEVNEFFRRVFKAQKLIDNPILKQ